MKMNVQSSAVGSLPAVPNPAKLFESLRHSGYTSEAAICDLVDNSIDAEATSIKILVTPKEGALTPANTKIVIVDDGRGMSIDTLDEAIRLGSEIEKDTRSDLGKFGMGLITASISIARKLTVITRSEGGQILRAVHDLDEIARKREFGAQLYQNDEESKKIWHAYTDNANTGTVIELTNCDNLTYQKAGSFIKKLHEELGEVFRLFIIAKSKRNGSFNSMLSINGEQVYALDPLFLKERKDFTAIGQNRDMHYSELIDDLEIEVPIDSNDSEQGLDKLKVKIVRLPDFSHTEKTQYGVSTMNEGIYILRNQRQIARAKTLGFFARHHYLIRFRAEIQFPATLDWRMGLNWLKQDVRPDQSLRDKMQNKLGPHIAGERLRRAKAEVTTQKIDHSPYQALITSKAKLLALPKQKEANEDEVRIGQDSKPRKVSKNPEVSITRPELRRLHERCIFREANMSPAGPLWDPQMEGQKMIITFNVEHPMWLRYVAESQEDERPRLLELLHMFAFCLSSAEFREFGDEEYVERLINMRSQMASNMRILLS